MEKFQGCLRRIRICPKICPQKKTPKGLLKFCETPVIQRPGFQLVREGFRKL